MTEHKCLDCEHLLQRFMCPCRREIREPSDFQNCTEFLNTWDFECEIDGKTLSLKDIEVKRECENFEGAEA